MDLRARILQFKRGRIGEKYMSPTKRKLKEIFEKNLIPVPSNNTAGDIWLWGNRWVSGKFGCDTLQKIYDDIVTEFEKEGE